MTRQRLLRGICGLLQQQHCSQRAHQLATAAVAAARPSAAHPPALLRSAAALYREFTSSSAARSSLTSLLAEEVKYEKDNYQRPEVVSGGPPAPFKLTEAPGDTLLTLTRTYKAEEVNVDLHVNNQPSPAFEGEEGGDGETASTVVFNVSVVRDERALVFECESDGNSVVVNHVSLEPKAGYESESMYTGPVFAELDDNLQRQFTGYLEERGITPELGEYLRFLIFDKEQREYQAWLQQVNEFVAK